MLTRTKTIVALILALMLLLPAIGALADYDGTAPVFEEKTTISILTCNGASKRTDVADMLWWQKVLEKANVDVELEIIDHSVYDDVVQPRLAAAQDLPDIVRVQQGAPKLTKSGIFIPLNDLIDKYGFNFKKFYDKYPQLESSITSTDGNIYYIPYIYTTESNSRTMMLNVPFLEALGMKLEDIKTVDDLYNYLVLVRDNDVNGNGDPNDEVPLFIRGGMIDLLAMYWGLDIPNTGGYAIKDGKVFNCYLTDEYRDFLRFVNKLYNENLINKEFLSANYDMQTAAFSTNTVGSIMHFVSNATSYSQAINPEWNFYEDEPIMQITALENNEGQPVVYGRNILGVNFGITRFCKDPEAAMKFIDYLYSEEVGIQTWYGTEGEDYNIVDGKYEFTNKYYDNVDDYRGNCGYNNDAYPGYQYDYSAVQAKTIFEQTKQVAPYTWNPTRMNKHYTDEQQDILNTYLTDLGTYFSENTTAFMIGTRSIEDEWDSFVSGAKDMGVEQVIAVYQAAEE